MVSASGAQRSSFYSVDIVTGQKKLIKSDISPNIVQAIGYNAYDNNIYGVVNSNPAQIARIDAKGTLTLLKEIPSAYGTSFNAGDVDENGHFWISFSGKAWLQIDLKTLNILASGTATSTLAVADWAYVPGGGNYLFGVTVDGYGNANLQKFNRGTKTWQVVGTGYGQIFPGYGVVGAVYATQDGFLYASENTGGKIYKLSLDGRTSTFITTNPTTSNNDGAHCINNVAGA